MQDYLAMLARYNAWANRSMFAAVAALPPGEAEKKRVSLFANMVHTLNHNFVIGCIFQAHLERRPHRYSARNTPDHPPLDELARAQAELDDWYVTWVGALEPAARDEKIDFSFIGGGEGSMTRAEILLHVVNHTSYHRGFVADMFYQVPAAPPATDITVFLRDGADARA